MVKTVGKYDLYGTLGEGAFGKVKYAVNTETNEAVAIKILDKDKIQTRNMGAQIKKEISIMKMINHHHVVSVKDVFATSAKIFIVLEFVGGGELFDKIANEGKLTEEKARFYFSQLLEGLEHCHNAGVCHRDLKPENLLLDTDGNLKISDFGFSTLNIGDADGDGNARAELLHTTCGTPNYVAPEVLGKDGYDGKKADVWSIGVILYVLLAGYLPFDENTMAALFQKIKHADFEYPDWFSEEGKDLISKVLVPDPQKRAKLGDLKNHPWMTKGDPNAAKNAVKVAKDAADARAAVAEAKAAAAKAEKDGTAVPVSATATAAATAATTAPAAPSPDPADDTTKPPAPPATSEPVGNSSATAAPATASSAEDKKSPAAVSSNGYAPASTSEPDPAPAPAAATTSKQQQQDAPPAAEKSSSSSSTAAVETTALVAAKSDGEVSDASGAGTTAASAASAGSSNPANAAGGGAKKQEVASSGGFCGCFKSKPAYTEVQSS